MQNASCHQDIITLENVSFSYQSQAVHKGLNFSVKERDFIGLIGSNGAGKTTLLRMIVGLLKPESGTIRLFGQPVSQFKDWDRIGYVPQKNSFNPLFPATVREVVLSGLYSRNKLFRKITKADQKKCEDALHAMNIEDLAMKRIGELSGGQQQRVFLARALINNPSLLILDEPTVGIDSETQEGFFHMIKHMHQHHNITFLMVSHDMEMIRSYLGQQPAAESGKLKFYKKHSHDLQNCVENDLTHSLKELRQQMESRREVVTVGDLG
ncbi:MULTISPECIES: metal ABC transporter ATP-binding protein [unclassified Paenibacillus]|uniref:metal ABC transporter ATP-binding protein n=1 Tax=unclassified Paenibacillus TaxID=185978 RepID=UPI001049588C|nr:MULTISPECIES: metal ABC transporter ATP-binding protein [unclassified Paenibacillus]NIK67579.1 zinc transport system ATP-binding protein [Paenibacillus sp. BK720]TCN01619.1 zinc transport system ATP-binding protein [Paenibacillus sp. BK033]